MRKNLLENPRFEGKEPLAGWQMEGGGEVKRAADALVLSSNGGAPFIYQQLRMKKARARSLFTFAAWVRSDDPHSAFLEFSDRRGTDIRSEPHPGDGAWRLMRLTVRQPEAGMTEFRLRLYGGKKAFIREVSLASGANAGLENTGSPAVSLKDVYQKVLASLGVLLAAAVALKTVRRYAGGVDKRFAETLLILLSLSSLMLMAGKDLNALVASNALWGIASLWVLTLIRRRMKGGVVKDALLAVAKRPIIVFVAPSLISLLAVVVSLKNGDVRGAEKWAATSFHLMLLGVMTSLALKAFSRLREAVRKKREDRQHAGAGGVEIPGIAQADRQRDRV